MYGSGIQTLPDARKPVLCMAAQCCAFDNFDFCVVFSVLIVQLSLHHIILNAPRTANGLLKSLVSEGKASEAKSLLHSLEEFFEPL